jgi:hypothetical protein
MPTAGYLDTVRLMIVQKTASPYNINIAMILNTAQLLKILYYFYHRFAFSLLGQCISLFLVSMTLTFLKFQYAIDETAVNFPHLAQNGGKRFKCPDFSNLTHLLNIWQASTFIEFSITIIIYSILGFAIFLVCTATIGEKVSVDATGLIANLIESTVSLPVFMKIVIRRQIDHISPILILQYFSGDLMKIAIFVLTKSPWPFLFGGFCQLTIDTVLSLTYLRLRFRPGSGDAEEAPGETVKIELETETDFVSRSPERRSSMAP